jgi:hypothetical protein
MNRTRFAAASIGALLITKTFVLAQTDDRRLTVPFSDPGRPGTVKVSVFNGGITVTASNRRDVLLTSSAIRDNDTDRSAKASGLRRLSQPAGLTVTEENNVMTIATGRFMGHGDVDIQVPPKTNLTLSTVNSDGIRVTGVDGNIEVTNVNGSITLTDVSGTVVAHSTNGEVHVTLKQVTPEKPMSFTSFNGDVDVTLPPGLKANLKMRTDHGEVLTDFDVKVEQRPPQVSAPAVQLPPVPPLAPVPPLPPLPPVAPGIDARERDRQLRERERQVRERDRQAANRGTRIELDSSIYGTVNGGGPEFELRTFNGDIYLRKAK